VQLFIKQIVGAVVSPVGHQYRLQGLIEVCTARTIEGERTSNAITILQLIVRVIPGVAVLCYAKAIIKSVVLCDGTLSNAYGLSADSIYGRV